MRSTVAILIAVALLSACKYAQVLPAGSAVQPVTEPPAADCKNLGVVTGKGGGGFGEFVPNERLIEYATNDALNKAGERGATHLVLMAPTLGSTDKGTTTTATLSGVAYQCPVAAPAATAAVPAAVPAAGTASGAGAEVAATVKATAQARSAPDKSAPARFGLAAGTRVMAAPAVSRGFRKVRTEDGRAGFVEDALLQVGAP
jgi:hypothetical protein